MIDATMELLDAPDETRPLHLVDGLQTDLEQANEDDRLN